MLSPSPHHVVNISGGKDSTSCYLLALERRERTGRQFRAVMADTGHEAEITMDYVRHLPERTGGPEVEIIRADFSRQMAYRRANIQRRWEKDGVPQERIDRALELMQPTGVPFLDLCILKGRFPSTKVRFCTEELKTLPLDAWQEPLLAKGGLVRWQGERREESLARSQLPMFKRVREHAGHCDFKTRPTLLIYRPIVMWAVEECFALHARHGLEPNPLYLQGMSRVGCFPCIYSGKAELREIARRFPEAVEKLVAWEALVSDASKRGISTFFAGDKTPEGRAMSAAGVKGSPEEQYPGAAEVFEWARTSRGGRQFNMISEMDDASMCASQYGLCE